MFANIIYKQDNGWILLLLQVGSGIINIFVLIYLFNFIEI